MNPSSGRLDAVLTAPIVALFLAGYVKASPVLAWVPWDLTVMSMVALVLAAGAEIVRTQRLPSGLWPLYAVVGTFLLAWANAPISAYAETKVLLLFGLTLPAAFCAAVVVSSEARAWWLARWTVLGGLGLALLLRVAPTTTDLYGRLAAEGSDTLAIGRGCGAAIVAVIALGIGHKLRWPIAVPVAVVLALVVFGSGSRGPLLGAGVGVVVVLLVRPGLQRVKYLAAAASLLVLVGPWLLARTSPAALDRILELFSADRGASVEARQHLYAMAAALGSDHPFGIGWGGFQSYSPVQRYPHNIALEIVAEAGWLAAIAFGLLVVVAVVRLLRQAHRPAVGAVLGLLVFWFTNAMFSGDVNDNRATFVLLAVGLVLTGRSGPDNDRDSGAVVRVERFPEVAGHPRSPSP